VDAGADGTAGPGSGPGGDGAGGAGRTGGQDGPGGGRNAESPTGRQASLDQVLRQAAEVRTARHDDG
jgi:hypothetical protein